MNEIGALLIIKALDGLAARSVATAQNVANASTRGYRPVRVSFEQALAAAAPDGAEAIRGVSPKFEATGAADSLRLDLELATATTTAERYSALVEILNRQLQLESIVAKGGG